MVYLHTQFASGNQFTAGTIPTGSVVGLSGLNDICGRVNSVIYDSGKLTGLYKPVTGSVMNFGSVWCGVTGTQIVAANSDRLNLLITNMSSTPAFIGSPGVLSGTGFKLNQYDLYQIVDTVAVQGCTSTGSVDVRYVEVY